jgi:hypothetical protein
MNPWCRPLKDAPTDRPAVTLLAAPSVPEEAIGALGAGSEEEGIPLVWERLDGEASALAREAARRSRLEVGIGLDGRAASVTPAKFPEERGVYLHEEGPDLPLRWIGQAAACLVKGEPLPPKMKEDQSPARLPVPEPTAAPEEEDSEEEALVAAVTRIVMEALEKERRR